MLLGYLTISTNVDANKRVVDDSFVLQQNSERVHLPLNTVQLQQCKTLNLLSPELWPRHSPELNSTDYDI